MRYKSLKQCVDDLERNGHLIRIEQEVDPYLEMAEIHRRVFQANGPAVYYANVKDSPFPAVSNLFGTLDRSRFLFRSTLRWVQRLVEVKADPIAFLRAPWRAMGIARIAFNTLPRRVRLVRRSKTVRLLISFLRFNAGPTMAARLFFCPRFILRIPISRVL